MKAIVCLILILHAASFCFGANDQSIVAYSSGEAVVDCAIDRLSTAEGLGSSFWSVGDDSSFFKEVALVESNYGDLLPKEYNNGGIWQVSEADFNVTQSAFFLETINGFGSSFFSSSQSESAPGQPPYHWPSIDYDDLTRPIISLIAARLVLHFRSRQPFVDARCLSVPTTQSQPNEYADYWYECYRGGAGAEDASHFTEIVGPVEDQVCDVAADVVFVLDASGSIGSENWERVRIFTRTFTDGLLSDSSMNQNKVGVITFSDSATMHSDLTDDRERLLDIITNLPYDAQYTNTPEGICQLLDISWGDEGRLRLVILMTDGQSNRDSETCGETLKAPAFVNDQLCPDPLYYVIGVTDNVDQDELEAIATSTEFIDHIDNYQNTADFQTFERSTNYQICFRASSFLCDGSASMSNFGREDRRRYQIEVSEGVTIRLCVYTGQVILYASTEISTPNHAYNTFVFESEFDCQDLFINPELDQSMSGRRKRQLPTSSNFTLYISIEGVANSSSFELETEPGDTSMFSVTCSDDPCGINTMCVPEVISYSCVCLPGYQFSRNLIDCIEIDECGRVPPVCHPDAHCTNTIGGYICSCNSGFRGDGVTCVVHREPGILVIIAAACGGLGLILLLAIVAAALVNISVCLARRRRRDPLEEKELAHRHTTDISK